MVEKAEDLLGHSDFIQRISRSLILDSHSAEDLSQDLWVAFLKNPPSPRGSLRSWLAGTLRNLSRIMFRRENRRRRRERNYSEQQAGTRTPEADENLEQEEILQQVVLAMFDLPEPFRSALILRFYEDLPYKEAAHRLDIPLDTMKYRLKRGLALMRDRLDNLHKGKRKKWIASLLPFTALTLNRSALAAEIGRIAPDLPNPIAHWLSPAQKAWSLLAGAKYLGSLLGLGATSILVWQLWPGSGEQGITPAAVLTPTAARESAEPADLTVIPANIDREALFPELFDPAADLPAQTAWKGTLVDYTGLPLADALIGLKRLDRPGGEGFPILTTRSGTEGRFKLSGLLPGRYEVYLDFPTTQFYGTTEEDLLLSTFAPWGVKTFKAGKTSARDLAVLSEDNAVVCVEVVEKLTGLPVDKEGIEVRLSNHPMCNIYFQTTVDPATGIACFRCVPAESYFIRLWWPNGYNRKYKGYVRVAPGEIKKDVRVTVPPLGTVRMSFVGFDAEELASLAVRCTATVSRMKSFENLSTELAVQFEEGPLRIEAQLPDGDLLTRTVDVVPGEERGTTIFRDDLTIEEHAPVKVYGRVRMPDGSPVGPVWVHVGHCRYGEMNRLRSLGFTGDRSHFMIRNWEPGYWALVLYFLHPEDRESMIRTGRESATPHPRTTVLFSDIEIPPNPSEPYLLDLVLPAGKVRGTICDGADGLPIHEKLNEWNVAANAFIKDRKVVSKFFGRGSASEFELLGLPAGEYYVSVDSPNYFHYKSEVFTLKDGEALDMGEIKLQPTGIDHLELLNPAGTPATRHRDTTTRPTRRRTQST